MSGEPVRHPVAAAVAEELPGLALWSLDVEGRDGASDEGVRRRLGEMAGRIGGARAVALRSQPIPHAYRVFFRHVGIDPDERRTPIEQAVLDRMFHGGFPSRGRLADALLVALVETGVPVWALDAEALRGELSLRAARPQDAFVPAGRLAIADAEQAVAELFGPIAPEARVSAATTRVRLVAVGVKGVPALSVEEALFQAEDALAGDSPGGESLGSSPPASSR